MHDSEIAMHSDHQKSASLSQAVPLQKGREQCSDDVRRAPSALHGWLCVQLWRLLAHHAGFCGSYYLASGLYQLLADLYFGTLAVANFHRKATRHGC